MSRNEREAAIALADSLQSLHDLTRNHDHLEFRIDEEAASVREAIRILSPCACRNVDELTATLADRAEDCRRCGGRNVIWFVPSPLWNKVMRGGDINGEALYDDCVCVTCFVILASEAGINPTRWRLTADPEPEGLTYTTPSGRVWDAERFQWVEPTDTPA